MNGQDEPAENRFFFNDGEEERVDFEQLGIDIWENEGGAIGESIDSSELAPRHEASDSPAIQPNVKIHRDESKPHSRCSNAEP